MLLQPGLRFRPSGDLTALLDPELNRGGKGRRRAGKKDKDRTEKEVGKDKMGMGKGIKGGEEREGWGNLPVQIVLQAVSVILSWK